MKDDFFKSYMRDELLFGMDDYDEIYGDKKDDEEDDIDDEFDIDSEEDDSYLYNTYSGNSYTSVKQKSEVTVTENELRIVSVILLLSVGFLGGYRFFVGKYVTGFILFLFGVVLCYTHDGFVLACVLTVIIYDLYKLLAGTYYFKDLGLYKIYVFFRKIMIKKSNANKAKVYEKIKRGEIPIEEYSRKVIAKNEKVNNAKWVVVLVFCIILGPLGIHRFIVKRVKSGIMMIVVSLIIVPIIDFSIDFGNSSFMQYVSVFLPILLPYIWPIFDIVAISRNTFKDSRGNVLKMSKKEIIVESENQVKKNTNRSLNSEGKWVVENKNTPYQLTILELNGNVRAEYFEDFLKMYDRFNVLEYKSSYDSVLIRVGSGYISTEKLANLTPIEKKSYINVLLTIKMVNSRNKLEITLNCEKVLL